MFSSKKTELIKKIEKLENFNKSLMIKVSDMEKRLGIEMVTLHVRYKIRDKHGLPICRNWEFDKNKKVLKECAEKESLILKSKEDNYEYLVIRLDDISSYEVIE